MTVRELMQVLELAKKRYGSENLLDKKVCIVTESNEYNTENTVVADDVENVHVYEDTLFFTNIEKSPFENLLHKI